MMSTNFERNVVPVLRAWAWLPGMMLLIFLIGIVAASMWN